MSYNVQNNSPIQYSLSSDEFQTSEPNQAPMIIMPFPLYQQIESQQIEMEKQKEIFFQKIETINSQCSKMIDCNTLMMQKLKNEHDIVEKLTSRLNAANATLGELEISNQRLKTVAKVFFAITVGYFAYLIKDKK